VLHIAKEVLYSAADPQVFGQGLQTMSLPVSLLSLAFTWYSEVLCCLLPSIETMQQKQESSPHDKADREKLYLVPSLHFFSDSREVQKCVLDQRHKNSN
jgi:hypothetical protein